MTDLFVAVGIIVLLALVVVARHFYSKNKISGLDKKFFQARWSEIEKLMEVKKEMNYKLAVIEADKLLDEALKQMFFPGGTTFDRLKFATYKFQKLKETWWAHKVRNEVVHNVSYALRHNEAQKVLELFNKALRTLGAI